MLYCFSLHFVVQYVQDTATAQEVRETQKGQVFLNGNECKGKKCESRVLQAVAQGKPRQGERDTGALLATQGGEDG